MKEELAYLPSAINPSTGSLQVSIDLANRSYAIMIGSGLFDNPDIYQYLPPAHTALVVSNTTVAPLYAGRLQIALQKHYDRVLLLALPDGESHKGWPTLQLIFDVLLENSCDRKTVLFAPLLPELKVSSTLPFEFNRSSDL